MEQGYVDDSKWNQWAVTVKGESYLRRLSLQTAPGVESDFHNLTWNVIAAARQTLIDEAARQQSIDEQADYESRKRELKDDGYLEGESHEHVVTRVKRYQSIVSDLKVQYNSRCQIEDCGFTFRKRRGGDYCEAHHLAPLAEGGTQDPSNVVILCANHHRMMHYADVVLYDKQGHRTRVDINGDMHYIVYRLR